MSEPTSALETQPGDELLSELTDDFLRRYRAGEHPSVDEYANKHPKLADRIRELFPAVIVMEQPDAGLTFDFTPTKERVGAIIGRYKLLERIGEGGFGVVYMAEQQHPVRRKVALKVIKPGFDTRQVIARFEAERQALALMEHENIAKVFDAGATDSGRPYFVMELVHGVPITEFCDTNQFTLRERLELFVQVCRAVQHAHTKGIIHRDIKPTNILVTLHEGVPVPKVIDFGVAKATGQQLTEKTLFTNFAQMVGTPLYMSPEQAEMTGIDVDTRSDVYSLGVLLYELLTGATPLDKDRLKRAAFDEVRRIIREDEPQRPSTRLSTMGDQARSISAQRKSDPRRLGELIRGELDWIVMKALDKERARRYETADGLASDIQRYMRDEPVEACPPSALYRVTKFVRRNKALVLTAAAVLLTLIGGIVGTTFGLLRAEQARRLQVERAEGERRAKVEAQTRLSQVEKGTEILASVLRDLDPVVAEKEGVTSRELLGRRLAESSQQLEGEAVGDPLVVARLQHLLGILLRELGHPEQAEAVLVKACTTRERLLGADHLDTVATRHDLASLYRKQEKYDRAEAQFKDVLAVRSAKLGADHLDTVATKHHLASVYCNLGKYELAEKLCKDVLPIRTTKLGPDNLDTLATKSTLARVYRYQGKMDLAEPLLREVVAVRTTKLGPDSLDTLISQYHLALVYRSQGKVEQAEALLKEVVASRAENHYTSASRCDLASIYLDQQNFALAEPLFKEELAIQTAKLGGDHPHTVFTRDSLARTYWSMKMLDQSIPLLEESLRMRKAQLGPDHPEVLARQVTLGANYCDAGRFADGIPLIEDVRRKGHEEPHPEWVRSVLLKAYVQAEKTAEATALVTEQVAEARERFPADSPELAAALTDAGQALSDAKAYAAAEPLYIEVMATRTAKLGAEHPDTMLSRDNLAALQRLMKKFDQMIPLLEESLSMRKAQLGPDHPELLGRQVALGRCYCDAGRFADGLPLIEGVRDKRRNDPHPGWVQNVLLAAYVQAGKTAEATALMMERVTYAREQFPADSPEVVAALADAGKCLIDAKAYADAEPLLLDGYNTLTQTKALSPSRAYEAQLAYALVQLYDAWGKPDEAAKWRKELEVARTADGSKEQK
jgi:tetratricopeptide (TPR) repeat protein